MSDAHPASYAEYVQRLVDMANNNNAAMDGTMEPVREICDGAEIVYGVYQDPAKQFGVGIVVVKGENLLRESVASGKNSEHRTTAIKCIDAEQAEALRDLIGDKVY